MKVRQANKSIKGKLLSFLANPPQSTEAMRQEVKDVLGVTEIVHHDKYLGLPSLIGRRKKKQVLTTSKREFGGNYKVGRRDCFHKQVGRF